MRSLVVVENHFCIECIHSFQYPSVAPGGSVDPFPFLDTTTSAFILPPQTPFSATQQHQQQQFFDPQQQQQQPQAFFPQGFNGGGGGLFTSPSDIGPWSVLKASRDSALFLVR